MHHQSLVDRSSQLSVFLFGLKMFHFSSVFANGFELCRNHFRPWPLTLSQRTVKLMLKKDLWQTRQLEVKQKIYLNVLSANSQCGPTIQRKKRCRCWPVDTCGMHIVLKVHGVLEAMHLAGAHSAATFRLLRNLLLDPLLLCKQRLQLQSSCEPMI